MGEEIFMVMAVFIIGVILMVSLGVSVSQDINI